MLNSFMELQKKPPRRILKKRCSKNMQRIYRRTLTPKCDFNNNKVALQLYWYGTSASVFFCIFAAYFQNNFSLEHLWVAVSGLAYQRKLFISCLLSLATFLFSEAWTSTTSKNRLLQALQFLIRFSVPKVIIVQFESFKNLESKILAFLRKNYSWKKF